MIFVLYFMLIGGKKMEAYVNDILPFNETNTQEVIHEINMIVRSMLSVFPYWLSSGRRGYDRLSAFRSTEHTDAGIPDLLCNHHSDGRYGIGMVSCSRLSCHQRRLVQRHRAFWLWGYRRIAIGQSHPVHPSKKMADTHPLITIFGVVIGLPIFGFMGVIFGPLLLSLFFLFVDMFKKEYLDLRNNLPSR